MHVRFIGRKQRVVVLGLALVAASLWMAPSSHTAPVGSGGAVLTDVQREMIAQRSLVRAAVIIKEAVDLGREQGYAGLVIEDRGVAFWWKGPLSLRLTAVVAEARKIAPVRVAQAKYSRAELKAAAARIRAQLGPGSAIHSLKDPGDGSRLIAAVTPEMGVPQAKSLLAQRLPDVGVEVDIIAQEELEPISRNNDQAPWSGGAVIVNSTRGSLCTAGFGVIANGSPSVLSAGHCAGAVGDRIQDGSGEFIGNVTRKTNHDQLILAASAASNRIYIGNRQSNTTKTVTDWEPCFVGELLCQSGVSTAEAIGSELCRIRVESFNMDSESLVEGRQIDGQQGARPGDSGGPLYSDQGSTVIAKGTMTRVAGSGVGFQDIPTANADFGPIRIPGGNPDPDPTAVVSLFQHCDFGGWRADFNSAGNVSTAQIQAAGGADNDASSIRVAPGFRAVLFNGNGQTGQSVTVTGNNTCFVGLSFNDVLSSMRIERVGDPGGGVVFFQNINFGGAQSQSLARGNYTLADLQARGVPNDWASSARIPAGFTVTLFQHDGFTGTSWTLTSDTASFVTLSPNANDQASSVRIQ